MDSGNNDKNIGPETLIETKAIVECESHPLQPSGRYGPLIARVPVNISKNKLHIYVESVIPLNHPAAAVRSCTKEFFLNQCKLLDIAGKKQGKLYIKGYIRESIEYAAPAHESKLQNSGDIRYQTVKLPVECTVKIDYITPPLLKSANRFINIGLPFTGTYDQSSNPYLHMHWISNNMYNLAENMFCELEHISITEGDMMDRTIANEHRQASAHLFDTVIEYCVVAITLTLWQWQPVNIPRYSAYPMQEI